MAALKASLGVSSQTTSTEHFLLLHRADADYIPKTSMALEQAYVQFYEAFARAGFNLSRSQGRLVWICFPQQSHFNKYARQAEGMDLSWLDGYYSTLTNRVAIVQTDRQAPEPERINPLLGNGMRVTLAASRQPDEEVGSPTQDDASGGPVLPTSAAERQLDIARLTHELAHQLSFNSGLQKRGVMYPLWVSEGLATNFEFDWCSGTNLVPCNASRRQCLVKTRAAGDLTPLRQFIVQTKTPADAGISRPHYAQAWAFFQYMLTEHPEALRSYLGRLAKLRPGRRDAKTLLAEFTEAFGSPEELEGSWNAFLDRQAQQVSTDQLTAAL